MSLQVMQGLLSEKKKMFAAFRREWRAKVFKLLFDFARRTEFNYRCLVVDKKYMTSQLSIVASLQKSLSSFLFAQKQMLGRFDKLKVYYDCGQAPVTNLLHKTMSADAGCKVEFAQNVKPKDYKLFQVADLICTVAHQAETSARGADDRVGIRFLWRPSNVQAQHSQVHKA